MTRVLALDGADVRSGGPRSLTAAIRQSPLVSARSARVLLQAVCLGAVVVAPSLTMSGLTALVAAQLLVGVCFHAVLRAGTPAGGASARVLRIWGAGALVSLVAVGLLHGVFHTQVWRAQLGAVVALVAFAVLGRMGDAYVTAGAQLDAILATLPPPATGVAHLRAVQPPEAEHS